MSSNNLNEQLAILNPEGFALRDVPKPVRVIGIDLGTTNSTVAEVIWHPDDSTSVDIRCVEIDQETTSGIYTHLLVPSAISLYQAKEWIGEGAKRLHARAPELDLELTRNLFLECKNDIGSRRTYHRAPEGYRSPAEIAARVLRFLKTSAEAQNDLPISNIVITVPASFQAAQRKDTVAAAKLAGIDVSGGQLLDEPVAAFLDFLLSKPEELKGALASPKNVVVFDFGGGTCDVAVFRLGKSSFGETLQISPLAVSRYHRLGGGDIDRAILYDVLLPQLLEQNKLEPFALTFEVKRNVVEPALIGVAEALKIGLCNEISRLQSFGQYDTADKSKIVKKQPGLHICRLSDRILELHSPSLSALEFEELLKPFLDHDLLYARESEYRLTCSIFAPIQDAVDRSKLEASEIDFCLLVGGSSLIPSVVSALEGFFTGGRLLVFPDRDATQVAVARGAATHSLALALFGRSMFRLITNDRISIRTTNGAYTLISEGSELPYPGGGLWAHTSDLEVPETSLIDPVSLLVEIVAGEPPEERPLITATWEIRAPANKGDKLRLDYRVDENQVLELSLTSDGQPHEKPFEARIENPLSNVVNPHATRVKIQEAEEELRSGRVSKAKAPEMVVEIARGYAELQQTEKAISYLKQALRMKNRPDPYVLNLLGIYHGELRDFDGQEKFYREAHAAGGGDVALFNLALSQFRRRKFQEAHVTIQESMQIDRDGPALTLAAQIEDALSNAEERDSLLREALIEFGPVQSIVDWELGWLITAARMARDTERQEEAEVEQKRRKGSAASTPILTGKLPDVASVLRKV